MTSARPMLRRRAALALMLASQFPCGAASAQTYTVAVVPQFPTLEIHRTWTPVLASLSARTGHRFELVACASIPAFEALFRAGQADFVYLNPYHMVMARRAQGYEPVLRDQRGMLSGLLVVQRDGPVRRLQDLQGMDVAFPSPNAFGASLYMRALLAQQGIDIRPLYVKTHSNAYRHVLMGGSAAAGGIQLTLAKESQEVRDGLRTIFETPAVAPHPLAAHPRVPQAVRDEVVRLFVDWARQEQEGQMLKAIQLPQPGRADYARDYLPLERLGLEKFVVAEE